MDVLVSGELKSLQQKLSAAQQDLAPSPAATAAGGAPRTASEAVPERPDERELRGAKGGFIMDRHLLAMLFGCTTLLLATGADARSSYDTARGTSLLLRKAEIATRPTITRST